MSTDTQAGLFCTLERVGLYAIEAIVAGLLILLVVITSAQVVMRYAFNSPLIWSEELARWLLIWLTFTGSALALKHRQHLDLGGSIFSWMAGRAKNQKTTIAAWGDLIADLATSLFSVILVTTSSSVANRLSTGTLVSVPLSLGYAYLVVVLAAAVMLLISIAFIIGDVKRLTRGPQ